MKRERQLVASIKLPTLTDGSKAWRCDDDPEFFTKFYELEKQHPNAQIRGNIHTGYEFWDFV